MNCSGGPQIRDPASPSHVAGITGMWLTPCDFLQIVYMIYRACYFNSWSIVHMDSFMLCPGD